MTRVSPWGDAAVEIVASSRVYFRQPGVTNEWELEGADVDEVLRWAADNACGRRYAVYACVSGGEGRGLIRLLGSDHP